MAPKTEGPDQPANAPGGADELDDTERAGPGPQVERDAADAPTDLPRASWWAVLRRTGKEFFDDGLPDHAAALTYYSVLSVFPALLALLSLLGVWGESLIDKLLANLDQFAPGPARDILESAVTQLRDNGGESGLFAVVGLLAALWSSSAYVGAFIRTANAVYDIPEGRPLWKVTPIRLGLTVVLLVLVCVSAVTVLFTGTVAKRVGTAVGMGDTAMTVWSVAKWPLLAVLVSLMIALLYWAAPNAKGRGLTWVSPGSLLALVLWLAASGGFAWYASSFGSFNKTYGTFAGIIVFLIWLWLTNLAILLGLEFDAEMARQRAISGGHPADEEPYIEPRDTQAWSEEEQRGSGLH